MGVCAWESHPATRAIVNDLSSVDKERSKIRAAEGNAGRIHKLLQTTLSFKGEYVVYNADGPCVQLAGTLERAVGDVNLERCTPVVGYDDRSAIGDEESIVDGLERAWAT
jgi:hypothetical protein